MAESFKAVKKAKASGSLGGRRYPEHFTEEDIKAAEILYSLQFHDMKKLQKRKEKHGVRKEGQNPLPSTALEQCSISLHIEESAEVSQKNASKNASSQPRLQIDDGDENRTDYPPGTPPVEWLKNLIQECSKPFQKRLFPTDMTDRGLRMRTRDVETCLIPLLKEEELAKLKKGRRGGISVTTYDMDGNDYPMMFKIQENRGYVLNGLWENFCKKFELKKNEDYVTVWMFRHARTDSLCFVISGTNAEG